MPGAGPISRLTRLAMLLAVTLVACACAEEAAAPTDAETLRLVSLSPALSRTLVDLGLADRLVGRSRFCDFLPTALPVVGDLHAIDYEQLVAVAPTHVLVQASAGGVDPSLLEIAATRGWTVRTWSGLDDIDDIETLVRELPAALYETGDPRLEPLTRRAAVLLNDMAAALRPGSPAAVSWTGSTLLVYNLEPVGVFGRGTYLDDVLRRLGATNAIDVEGWPDLTLEDVTRVNPAAIVLVRTAPPPPPDAGPAAAGPMGAAGVLASLDIAAVRDGRIAILTHSDALRPCTGVIGVANEMRAVLAGLAGAPGSSP